MYTDIATNWLKKLENMYFTHKKLFETEELLIRTLAECFLSLNLLLPNYSWFNYCCNNLFYYTKIKPYEDSYYSTMMLQGGQIWRLDSTVKITKNITQTVLDDNGNKIIEDTQKINIAKSNKHYTL